MLKPEIRTSTLQRRAPTDGLRIAYALLVLIVASSMERNGNHGQGAGADAASRQRRPFFAVSSAASVGNNTPNLIPIGGRDRHACRPSMDGRSSAHTPLTRDALRAERISLQNSNAASTTERRRHTGGRYPPVAQWRHNVEFEHKTVQGQPPLQPCMNLVQATKRPQGGEKIM